MSRNELAQVQNNIDDSLEVNRIKWLKLATAGLGPEERKQLRDEIASNEAHLMAQLERKWALQRN
jgi:hypothetical protein